MTVQSPLVAAYLADLDRALAGADPADRLEIVDAVREHIDAAVFEFGAAPTQAEIAGVLRRLGTADDVAAAWAVGADRPPPPLPLLRPTAHGLQPVPAGETGPRRLPVWLIGLLVLVALVAAGPVMFLLGALALRLVGALVFLLPVLIVAGTVACGVAWRRSTTHRGAWLTGFVAGLVLVVGTAVAAAGWIAVGSDGGSSGGSVQVTSIPMPTPAPGSGLP
ncbi:MAG TPA: hypothetical protein VGC04_13165 [Cellulomonas sp.]